MAIIRLQGNKEKEKGIYYEFDTSMSPLGEGGMGKVYRGRMVDIKTHLAKDVAIKFMFDGLAPSVIERARREASIQISHENLVEMMGFLTTETKASGSNTVIKHYHVVSELLDGVMLADLLSGVVTGADGRTIPYAQKLYAQHKEDPYGFALFIVRNITSGIMALHDAGYIHRDIDPTNIMVTRDGKIKLIDFGIAKRVNNLETQDKNLTQDGQFMGKAQYASPELILGDVRHQNCTTDIYAIGILLFRLITGKLPFDGPSNVIIKAQLNNKLPLRDISIPTARKVVAKATEKDPTKRYQSAAELRVAIEQLKSLGSKVSTIDKLMDMVTPKIMGIAIAAVIAIGVGAYTLSDKNDNDNTDNPTETTAKHENNKTNDKKETSGKTTDIENVKNELSDKATVQTGLAHLKEMCNDANNTEAIYILSRLYCADKKNPPSDAIVVMQNNISGLLTPSNSKAHELLLMVVNKDPDNYMALYDLGIDYYRGKERGTERDLIKSRNLFTQALNKAKKNGDPVYESKIQGWLSKF